MSLLFFLRGAAVPSANFPAADITVGRTSQQSDYRLSLAIEHADGSTTRWGPGEIDGADIPTDLEFSTSMPGGFKDMQSSLLRRIDRDYPDQNLLDTVRVLGPGNETAWEGRMTMFPRQHGDQYTVQPGAEGWVAHLRDDETFSMIYVDRSLDGWGPPSRSRRSVLLAAGRGVLDSRVEPDITNGLPALTLPFFLDGSKPIVEPWYDAGPGNLLGELYIDWTTTSWGTTASDANWQIRVYSSSDDALSASTDLVGSSLNQSVLLGAQYVTVGTARRYVLLEAFYDATTSSAPTTERQATFRKVTVYGDHDLTQVGDAPGGFYGGDIIEHALAAAAPRLVLGDIDQGSVIIAHLVFRDPTQVEEVVRQVTDYEAKDWGVYDRREFFWRDPDPDRCCWQARLDEGARPSFDGPAGQTLLNGVFVVYKDPAGTTHTVGPPGSNAETTDSTLADSDSSNPATALGIRKWAKLNLDVPTTEDNAIFVGAAWLADRLSPQRRGSVTLTGTVTHPTKGRRPVWAVRSGDYIQITDSGNNAQRRIIETRYDHATRTNTLTLDNADTAVEALIQRFGLAVAGVI
jgi:hypothetical protein